MRYAIEHPSHYRVMFGAYEVNKQTYLSLADASKQALMVLVNVIVEGRKQEWCAQENPGNWHRRPGRWCMDWQCC
jgi:hypothetical protein